jgi:hypothetical protein
MGILSSKPDLTASDLFWHVEFAKVMIFHQIPSFWGSYANPFREGRLKLKVFYRHAIIDELLQ